MNKDSEHQEPLLTALRRFIVNSDTAVMSLSASATLITDAHAEALSSLGIDAVGIASQSRVVQGTDTLETTLTALKAHGIVGFGAGKTPQDARDPHRIFLPARLGGGEIHMHAAAESAKTGGAPLSVATTAPARTLSTPLDSLQIALPTWDTGEHNWRTSQQFTLAHRLLAKDYDLVLGHGTERLQEVHRKQRRWVVYSLGNGLQADPSEAPSHDHEGFPFGLWTVLEIHTEAHRRWVEVKLYPVTTGSAEPGPVNGDEFERVAQALSKRPERPWRFANPAMSTGEDDLGRFIRLQAGEWPIGERLARLEPNHGAGDAGDWPLRSPSLTIEDRILGSNKQLGVAMLAVAAEAEGGTIHWLGRTLALIESRGKRLLSFRYRNHETSLGAVLVRDKVLTARILERAGVPTPKTFLVKTSDEAVEAARTVQGPVVIKPRFGVESIGVSTSLTTDEEVREAFRFARDNGSQVILQPHIHFSEELRVMASPEGAMAVNGRVLPHVIGDGVSTIAQLIADKNRQRTLNPSLEKRPIPIDPLTHRQLSRLGFTVDSVPELGTRITVRNVAGLSVGGDTIQALDETSREIKAAAVNAVAAIPGLGWGGADVIVEDGTQRPLVIEINTQAAYGAALFPAYGEPKDVSAAAWAVRYDATAPEVKTRRETVEVNAAATPAVQNRRLFGKNTSVAFRQLFLDALTRLPNCVTKLSLSVREISTARGTVLVTRTGLTAADRFVVEKVMTRHQWVSRILALRDLPQPPSARVTTATQLRRFVKEHPGDVTLRTMETAWKEPNTYRLTAAEAADRSSLPGTCWVQSSPVGPRLRVLASHLKAHTIIVSQEQGSVSAETTRAAGLLAVEAVRAVPELRWAAVDIALSSSVEGTAELLVEGMTTAPSFTTDDQVIAGGVDEFCQWIVEADDVPLAPGPLT